MADRPIEELQAAMSFVETMVPRADDHDFNGVYPLWYGWALQDAFWAGIDWARKQDKKT